MAAPVWLGATSGAAPAASQINQFLFAHAFTLLYAAVRTASQTTAGSGAVNSNALWIAQSFTTGAGQSAAGRVVLTLAVTGSPAPLTVGLYASSGSAPTGSALVSVAVPKEFLTGTGAALSIPLPATVAPSTTYWIVATAVGDASDYFSWSKSNQTTGASTSTNGTSWTAQTYGLLFQVYDQAVTGSPTHTFEDSGARWTGFAYTSGQVTGLQEYTAAQASGYVKANSTLTYSGTSLAGVTQSSGVPAWSAARSGLLGDPGAVDASAEINQFLGAHSIKCLYQGAPVVTPAGVGVTPGTVNLGTDDWDQPFTMSGTTIGRVTIPVAASGNGADLVVSLCPDSAGSPGVPIVSTRIPAAWILALSAVGTLAAGSTTPLATATSSTITIGPGTNIDYAAPAVSVSGGGVSAGTTTAGNNLLLVGGLNAAFQAVPNVFSITYTGGTMLAPAVPQPSLPQALYVPGVAATPDTLVSAGGIIPGSTPTNVSSVYTASLNPSTGVVGAWSAQASLPQGLSQFGIASSGQHIYIVGGYNGTAPQSTVYWTTVQNGQITGWNTGPSLPAPNSGVAAVVVNGYLVLTDATNSPKLIRYAQINADGSLGGWQVGPTIPHLVVNATASVPGVGLVLVDGYSPPDTNVTETFAFGPSGPGGTWQVQRNAIPTTQSPYQVAVFPTGTGTWQIFSLLGDNTYFTQQLSLTPSISVPLPATSLTSGTTYHVTMSQQGGSLNDYLVAGQDSDIYTGNPTALYRARSGGSGWTATTAGNAVPIQVYDQTVSGTWPLHTWEDGGARHTMFVNNTTPDNTPLGLLEATAQPAPVLNVNPTFTTGTAPWVATGATVAQSPTFTHGNLPFSGRLTPSGSASSAYIESEKVPVLQGHNYVATAWLYSGPGYANCAVNINWYSAASTFLSTTSGTVTPLPAATWTQVSTASTAGIPAGSAYGTIVATQTGTPPSSAVLFISSATMQDTSGPMLASVTQINYPATGANQMPTGITQLA